MSHDVFISHSSLDKLAADAVCHGLEARGIRCWMAPRDQIAGKPYGEQITEAIASAQVMVLVFSQNVNNSQAVLNEINIAAGGNVTIVPFRIAQADFSAELNFYLGRMHWLDAFPQPVDAYIDTLVVTIRRNLEPGGRTGPAVERAAPVASPPQPDGGHAAPPVPVQRAGLSAGAIIGSMLGGLLLLLLIVMAWPRPPNPAAAQATNRVMQAIANSIARNADDGDEDEDARPKPAAATSEPASRGSGRSTAPSAGDVE
ncbi:MAG TPA: toll/interleukin-1 receptor domain-containing protein [Caulobacteraceae bacterium]|jgi:hypothetical protein|nr:toll/interleukin-1 receptor domain-containing protein [Caulobacteraceae bacterium]